MPNGMVIMCGKMILSIDNVLKNYKMKMKLFFRILVLAFCISMSLSSYAQDQQDRISVEKINWSANNQSLGSIVSTSDAPKITYLYATTPKKFVTVGGRYGAQPILAEVGMNFYVEKVADDDNRYYIHSWVDNPTTSQGTGNADYLGVKPAMDDDERIFSEQSDKTKKSIYLFVDRGKLNTEDNGNNSSPDRIKWYIESVDDKNGYKIYSKWTDNQGYSDDVERKYYLSYYQGPKEENPQKKFLVVTTEESNAGKIFAERNPYEDKDVDSRKYDNSVAVLVKADEGSETGTLYIGAGKRANEGGYAYFDNFQLFYMGDKQWYLDATNTSNSEFTTTKNASDTYYTPSGINRNPEGADHYKYPVIYNIRRFFNVGKWESLILPCTLTGDQVKQTFGGDQEVKLSVFDKVEGTCVYFKTVDTDKEGIVADKLYIIKVGKEADIKTKNEEYTFPWGNNTTVKVKGPIYQVKGVVPPTFIDDGVTREEISGGYKVQFHGFYYDSGAAPANAYVVNNGKMHHLLSDWDGFVGTSWYVTITDAQGNAKALSFSFDGDSSTTAIENVAGQEDAAVQTDGFVYNLSGQRVGTRNNMGNLSSGIYVVAGKKFVVK